MEQRIDITAGITLQKASKLDYGVVEVVVSNSGTDRHGEQIIMEGIDLTQIKRNPVLLWAHDYSSLPIGRIEKIWKDKSSGNLMARIRLDYDIYDFADTVYKMIQRGTLNAVSIGGIVREFGDDRSIIKELEMVELSVVPVGAHPDALVTAKSIGMNPEDFTKQYESFLKSALVDKISTFPDNEIVEHVKALKSLTSALESALEDSADTDAVEDLADTNKSKTVKKLVVLRQTAKQCDKQSELIISAVNKQLSKF